MLNIHILIIQDKKKAWNLTRTKSDPFLIDIKLATCTQARSYVYQNKFFRKQQKKKKRKITQFSIRGRLKPCLSYPTGTTLITVFPSRSYIVQSAIPHEYFYPQSR